MIVCPWKDLGRYASVIPGLAEAVEAINALTDFTPASHPLPNGCKFIVQQGTTKAAEGRQLEAHRQFLDIQYILEGGETVGWAPVDTLTPADEFNTEKDAGMYTGHCDYLFIQPGYCYVVFPEDAHLPMLQGDGDGTVLKAIVKIRV